MDVFELTDLLHDPAKDMGWQQALEAFKASRKSYGTTKSSAACVDFAQRFFNGVLGKGLLRHNYWEAWQAILNEVRDLSEVGPEQVLNLIQVAISNPMTTTKTVEEVANIACGSALSLRLSVEGALGADQDPPARYDSTSETAVEVLDTLAEMLSGYDMWDLKRLEGPLVALPVSLTVLIVTYLSDLEFGVPLVWRCLERHAHQHDLTPAQFLFAVNHLQVLAPEHSTIEYLDLVLSTLSRLVHAPAMSSGDNLFRVVRALQPEHMPREASAEIKSWRVPGLKAAMNPASLLFNKGAGNAPMERMPRMPAGIALGPRRAFMPAMPQFGTLARRKVPTRRPTRRSPSPASALAPATAISLISSSKSDSDEDEEVISYWMNRKSPPVLEEKKAASHRQPSPYPRALVRRRPPSRQVEATTPGEAKESAAEAKGKPVPTSAPSGPPPRVAAPKEEGNGTVVTVKNDALEGELVEFQVRDVFNMLAGECKVSNLFPVCGVQCRLIVYPAGTASNPNHLGVFLALDYKKKQRSLDFVDVTPDGVAFPDYVAIALLHPHSQDKDVERALTRPIQFGHSVGFEAMVSLSDMKITGFLSPREQGSLIVGVVTRPKDSAGSPRRHR